MYLAKRRVKGWAEPSYTEREGERERLAEQHVCKVQRGGHHQRTLRRSRREKPYFMQTNDMNDNERGR